MENEKVARRIAVIDLKLKAMFDLKAAEPVPEHLVDLANELDEPAVSRAS